MRTALMIMALVTASVAFAADSDWQTFYVGGGFSSDGIDPDITSMGVQLFGGVPVPYMCGPLACLAGEAGYQKTAEIKSGSWWAAAVGSVAVRSDAHLVVRYGPVTGDYGKVIAGVGIDYEIQHNMSVRMELVSRHRMDSLQFNLVYYPGRR